MIILAIDTSCDETSVAITQNQTILSNVISTQVRYHKKFGGVVPFLAQRLHRERIDSVIALAIERAGLSWADIEAIAVTQGPGLAPALEVGIQKAKDLATAYSLPLYAINHMAGHIASCFVKEDSKKTEITFPCLALLVSGGHTEMVLMSQFGSYDVIGQTLDDALGEAYDKVAKMLGLGYPGGKLVAKLAQAGDASVYELPIPMQKSHDLNFSYSGLKNAVRLLIYSVKDNTHTHVMEKTEIENICASFEKVAQASIMQKLEKALVAHPDVTTVLLAGGVASNTVLRKKIRGLAKKKNIAFVFPAKANLCTDNAAMIGVAAALGIQSGQLPVVPEVLDRKPGLTL